MANCSHCAFEIAALLGQVVFDAHRDIGIDVPSDNTFVLQFPQPLAEEAIAQSWDGAPQGTKAAAPRKELAEDCPGPPAPDEFDRLMIVRAE